MADLPEVLMQTRRMTAVLAALLLVLSLGTTALAQPAEGDPPFGRGPEDRGRSADAPGRFEEQAPAAKLPGKPRDDVLPDVPVDPDDASIPMNLIPYHEFAPRLRALQESDRIAVEIIGQTVLGRDMHLAVATAPMTDAEWDSWQRLSDLRTDDPDAALAALDAGEYDHWRTPLLVSSNIHGNEWEGTDATFQVLEELATSNDPAVTDLLEGHVLAFVVSNNPDGRVAGQRANANGFDVNRDYITASQPEARAVRAQIVRYDPLTFLDIHGYVNCTLIEPTTGPHGENYEYDLYIRHAIRNALSMEQAIIATGETRATCAVSGGGRRVDIPWRNRLTGWDDWPPIFTPMYAMYHGTVGHTVEIPLNPRGGSLSQAERHERTRINTAAAVAAIEGNFTYATDNAGALLADQLELFRRGQHGEGARPIDDELALSLAASGTVQGQPVDNAETFSDQTYPDAYVITAGDAQRSASAAARVAQFLIDNDVGVHRAWRPLQLGGRSYEAGSYVVGMRQAKRGLANTILDTGRDVTTNFPTMYDISAWSQGELWGATVERVEQGTPDAQALRPAAEAAPSGSVAPGRRRHYGLEVRSVGDIQAVHALLGSGVELGRTDTGTFVVSGEDRTTITEVADTHGVEFLAVPASEARGAAPFASVRLGTSAPFDEVFALARMGFDLTSVNHNGFNDGTYSFDEFDAFYVSTTPRSTRST
jgi:hypothetical protein